MYSVFLKLLALKGLTVADVCKATGISQSTMSNWKRRNNLMTGKNAKILADFFGVSLDYLMTGNDDGYYTNDDTAQAAEEVFRNKDLRILFDAARDSKPEDIRLAAEMLKRLKETNPDG